MRKMSYKIFNGVRRCKCCGNLILFQGYDENSRICHIMERKMVCHDCAYWLDLIKHPQKDMEILDHECLIIHPHIADKKDKAIILGGKGKKRWFIKPGGTLIASNDIWIIGTVPERFQNSLPPTVYEITLKAYNQLKRNPRCCISRACMDRYHCFRFDKSLEEENGPFNIVPEKWKVGGEHCGFRIDPKEILSDDSSAQTLKDLINGRKIKRSSGAIVEKIK